MPTVQIRRDWSLDVPAYGTWMDADELESLVRRSGSHFFDADTKRFFRSKLHDVRPGVDGWYFITSEQHVTNYPTYRKEARQYTVRRLSINAEQTDLRIDELENFQHYATLGRARTALKKAAGGTIPCPECGFRLVLQADPQPCAECQERAARRGTVQA